MVWYDQNKYNVQYTSCIKSHLRCCIQRLIILDESSNTKSHIFFFICTLGNEKLHHLLSQGTYQLRMDMSDFTGQTRYVKYTHVNVSEEHNKYRMSIAGYSGNVGKSFGFWKMQQMKKKNNCSIVFFHCLFVFCFSCFVFFVL